MIACWLMFDSPQQSMADRDLQDYQRQNALKAIQRRSANNANSTSRPKPLFDAQMLEDDEDDEDEALARTIQASIDLENLPKDGVESSVLLSGDDSLNYDTEAESAAPGRLETALSIAGASRSSSIPTSATRNLQGPISPTTNHQFLDTLISSDHVSQITATQRSTLEPFALHFPDSVSRVSVPPTPKMPLQPSRGSSLLSKVGIASKPMQQFPLADKISTTIQPAIPLQSPLSPAIPTFQPSTAQLNEAKTAIPLSCEGYTDSHIGDLSHTTLALNSEVTEEIVPPRPIKVLHLDDTNVDKIEEERYTITLLTPTSVIPTITNTPYAQKVDDANLYNPATNLQNHSPNKTAVPCVTYLPSSRPATPNGISFEGQDLEIADVHSEEDEEETEARAALAEEDEFAHFVSRVKNRDVNAVRQEIDDEINTLRKAKKLAMRDSEDVTQQMSAEIMVGAIFFGLSADMTLLT